MLSDVSDFVLYGEGGYVRGLLHDRADVVSVDVSVAWTGRREPLGDDGFEWYNVPVALQ